MSDREQSTLLPECLDDFIDESNPVRVIDVFVDALDLAELGFEGVEPAATGRPSYHPAVLLKLYIYGYLNRVQSSRRLEREASRNVELMWLLGRLVPDHKTIADFRKDNGKALKKVCARFVELCREMGLLAKASVAIDGSKFKAVNNRDRNFTKAKVERRRAQLEESVARYLWQPVDNRQTSPVGSFKPNAFGLYDMAGNVWQWVQDCYRDNYRAPTESALTSECSQRVVRDGAWDSAPRNLRSAGRIRGAAGSKSGDVGFRLGRTLTP